MWVISTDGIYEEVILPQDSDKEWNGFVEAFLEGFNLDFQIGEVEWDAKKILADAGLTFPCDVPNTADPIVRDAKRVLERIRALRDYREEFDIDNTALQAYFIGRIVEVMAVRSCEQYAQTGRIHKAKSSDGAKKRAENAQRRHRRWFQRAKELIKKGLSVESAAKQIHKEEVKTYNIELDKWQNDLRMDPPAKPRSARTISKVISQRLKSEQQQSSRPQSVKSEQQQFSRRLRLYVPAPDEHTSKSS